MKKALLAVCTTVSLGLGVTVTAQADTLENIKERGSFICGTMGTAEPFSFQDPKTRAVVGYEVDMCQAMADSLGVPLDLKLIAVEARIPELVAGRVDLVAANLGWSPERAKQIDYSYQHFVSDQKVLARESDTEVNSPADLEGKRVSAVRGSSSEQGALTHIPNVNALTFKDPSGAFLALQQGKVSGFVASEMMLVKLVAQAANSAEPAKILEPALFVEPWGMGIRKGDTAFRDHVNGVLTELDESGEAEKMFVKWFGPDTPFNMTRSFQIEEISE